MKPLPKDILNSLKRVEHLTRMSTVYLKVNRKEIKYELERITQMQKIRDMNSDKSLTVSQKIKFVQIYNDTVIPKRGAEENLEEIYNLNITSQELNNYLRFSVRSEFIPFIENFRDQFIRPLLKLYSFFGSVSVRGNVKNSLNKLIYTQERKASMIKTLIKINTQDPSYLRPLKE